MYGVKCISDEVHYAVTILSDQSEVCNGLYHLIFPQLAWNLDDSGTINHTGYYIFPVTKPKKARRIEAT